MAMQWSKGFGDAAGQVQEGLLRALDIRKSDEQLERQRKRDELSEKQTLLGMKATEQQMAHGAATHQWATERQPFIRMGDELATEAAVREAARRAPNGTAATIANRFAAVMGRQPSGILVDANGNLVKSESEARADRKEQLGVDTAELGYSQAKAQEDAFLQLPEALRPKAYLASRGVKATDYDPAARTAELEENANYQIKIGKATANHANALRDGDRESERTRPLTLEEELGAINTMGVNIGRQRSQGLQMAQQALRNALAGTKASMDVDANGMITISGGDPLHKKTIQDAERTYRQQTMDVQDEYLENAIAGDQRIVGSVQFSDAEKKNASARIERNTKRLQALRSGQPGAIVVPGAASANPADDIGGQ